VSQRKECVSELSGFIREAAKRVHQVNSQTQGEISRWLSTLERKTVWESVGLLRGRWQKIKRFDRRGG
jgi:hypothetical protein